jgi:hypothetical protein
MVLRGDEIASAGGPCLTLIPIAEEYVLRVDQPFDFLRRCSGPSALGTCGAKVRRYPPVLDVTAEAEEPADCMDGVAARQMPAYQA